MPGVPISEREPLGQPARRTDMRLSWTVTGLGLLLALTACGQSTAGTLVPQLAAAPAACPAAEPDGITDWVAFVQHAGVQYLPNWPRSTVPEHRLGPVVGTVTCRRSTSTRGAGEPVRDGDAAYLPAGTELRALAGVDPTLRIAVHVTDGWEVYDAQDVDSASNGADLLDLRQVVRVSLVESQDGTDVVRSLDAAADLARLVAAIRSAPVIPQDEVQQHVRGPLWFVRFELAQGPSVQKAWYPDGGILFPRIVAPPVLRDLLKV